MGKSAFSRHYIYRIALALLVLVLFVLGTDMAPVHARSNTTGDEIKRLDEYVQSEMQAASIPGLAYGIVKDGQVVHLAAFGVTGPSGQPMMTQTPMHIGSVGKTMTALAIRQLINAGKIDPDAPLCRSYSNLAFWAPGCGGAEHPGRCSTLLSCERLGDAVAHRT